MRIRFCFCALLIAALAITAHAQTRLETMQYNGWDAFRLSDGRSEAIVVPAIGRVMRFGFVGGPNLLWNAPREQEAAKSKRAWRNWGGDKTWPAPQSAWSLWCGSNWPPIPAWDAEAHEAETLPDNRLRTLSIVEPGLGARIVREYGFENGEFVIQQRIEKVEGAGQMVSLWSVSQIAPPDAVFVPLNPDSAYREGFYYLGGQANAASLIERVGPQLLRLKPGQNGNYKIGADALVAALACVSDGVAWVQRAAKPTGQYPDGALGAGFPVEVYDRGAGLDPKEYLELELLGPLRLMKPGAHWTHTVRWSLHSLATPDVQSPELAREVAALLQP